jgi:hypothetical protein
MKKLFSFCCLLCFCLPAIGQTDSFLIAKNFSLALNEFSLSVNNTTLRKNGAEDGFGFGLGVYHCFMKQRRVNIIWGLEFNLTNQYWDHMYAGRFSTDYDVTMAMGSLSAPLAARINFGKKIKFFIEPGTFLDLPVSSRVRATRVSYILDQDMHISGRDTTEYTGKGANFVNYGFSMGIGLRIPVKKYELFIKTEYKYGFNKDNYNYKEISNCYLRLMLGFKI